MGEPDSVEKRKPHFQVGGSLEEGAYYVDRPADATLLRLLRSQEFCLVFGPRQIGKSSLRHRTEKRLRESGIRCAAVDLNLIGKNLTPEQWCYGMMDELRSQLELEHDLDPFWTRTARLAPMQRWSRYLRDEVLTTVTEPVVVFVDEIDTLIGLEAIANDFLASVRTLFEERPRDSSLRRLTFCLMGVATMDNLIRDGERTPFNIGQALRLEDFTLPQVMESLLPGLERFADRAPELLRSIMEWTSGHPFHTLRLCDEVVRNGGTGPFEVEPVIAGAVKRLFLDSGRLSDFNLSSADLCFGQEHYRDARVADMLNLYRRLLRGERVPVEGGDAVQMALQLTGLAAVDQTVHPALLRTRSRIFTTVFGEAWVRERETRTILTDWFTRWFDNGRSDTYVLRGDALDRAHAWAEEHRHLLSADEQHFLRHSTRVSEHERELEQKAQHEREKAEQERRLREAAQVLAEEQRRNAQAAQALAEEQGRRTDAARALVAQRGQVVRWQAATIGFLLAALIVTGVFLTVVSKSRQNIERALEKNARTAEALKATQHRLVREAQTARAAEQKATTALAAGEAAREELAKRAAELDEARNREKQARTTAEEQARNAARSARDAEVQRTRAEIQREAAMSAERTAVASLKAASQARQRAEELQERERREARKAQKMQAYLEKLNTLEILQGQLETADHFVRGRILYVPDKSSPLYGALTRLAATFQPLPPSRLTADRQRDELRKNIASMVTEVEERVLIPGGKFLTGCDRRSVASCDLFELAFESIEIPSFCLAKTEVTVDAWRHFMTERPLRATPQRADGGDCPLADPARGQEPITCVTWEEAEAYCRAQGGRLPTELEWEKAARGTDGRTYPWGNFEPDQERANFMALRAAQVGRHTSYPSPYGLLDIAGNVWEWTADEFREPAERPRSRPKKARSDSHRVQRTVRGGGFVHGAAYLRTSARAAHPETQHRADIGFRCVWEVDPQGECYATPAP